MLPNFILNTAYSNRRRKDVESLRNEFVGRRQGHVCIVADLLPRGNPLLRHSRQGVINPVKFFLFRGDVFEWLGHDGDSARDKTEILCAIDKRE